MNFIYERIEQMLSRIYPLTKRAIFDIDGFEFAECGYKTSDEPDDGLVFRPWTKKDRFGGKEEWHGWYRKTISNLPECPDGCSLELENYYDDGKNPQYLVYLDDKLVQGTDKNHTSVKLDPSHGEYKVKMYVYTGYDELDYIFAPKLVVRDDEVTGLYYDIKVPFDVLTLLDKNTKDYVMIRDALNEALNLLDWRAPGSEDFLSSVKAARAFLADEVYGKIFSERSDDHPNIASIGHTHIDVAWLWTFAQTREKVQRSFSTVVELMKRYPEYKFMSSQAQLYKFLKEDAPETYAEVKKLISEGRWEVEGAMWVEADTNLTGGEALIRQIVYGKRFFRDEFGVESHVLWLPDVFGYSAAMPQILRKCNVDRFVTSKISWNETNLLPHDVFDWQGIDGTKIFSYFITSQHLPKTGIERFTTYNSSITPSYIMGTWNRMQDKELTHEAMNPFGYGDGGGGPTVDMLEYGRRMTRGIGPCPTVTQTFAGDFLDRLEENARQTGKIPSWVGELYLEYHRGTYTSIAKNKKNNRYSENLYMNAEALSVLDGIMTGAEYPRKRLADGWEKIMLCQFHDVLPGSSIKPVYDDCDVIYADVIANGEGIVSSVHEKIASMVKADDEKLLVFNQNGFAASGLVEHDGKTVYVSDIPSKGYAVVAPVCGHKGAEVDLSSRTLENSHIKVRFNSDWEMEAVYDKDADREALCGVGNRLMAHEDFPRAYDAWEITNYYKEKAYRITDVTEVSEVDLGASVGVRIVRKYGNSVITQTITVSPYDKAVKVKNNIDWHERNTLLKAYFPIAVNADSATYEIQYGHVTRPTHENTSWDSAKFEVCAHKYADVSEHGYGVSLLNDYKYGYSCSDTELALTLLKSATYPNPEADQGIHEFSYVLLPHEGDFRDAGVVESAYLLARPLAAMTPNGNGTVPDSFELAKSDRKNVIIEAVKAAEDDENAVIVRLYDAYNMRSTAKITVGFDAVKAFVCDMEENEQYELPLNGREITVPVGSFEIVTLKLYKK